MACRVSLRSSVLVGLVLLAALRALPTAAAIPADPHPEFAAATAGAAPMLGATDLLVRFIQEGEPGDGHVRVEVTPEGRALTILEARSAAQEAFLAALDEPGLGDDLTRIWVVVRLTPAISPGPDGRQKAFLFVHKGGREWSLSAGD